MNLFLCGFDLCLTTYALLCMHKMLFWFIVCLSTFGNLKSVLHLFQMCAEVEVDGGHAEGHVHKPMSPIGGQPCFINDI